MSANRSLAPVIGLLQITRPHNCGGAASMTLLGAYLGSGFPAAFTWPVLQAAGVVGMIVAACNALNDYHDVAVDQVNNPRRPLPAGRLPRRAALWLAGLLALAALGATVSLGLLPALIAVVSLSLGSLYSFRLKSSFLAGHFVVGLLSGMTVLYGGLVAGGLQPSHGIAAGLVGLFVFTREILKAIADQTGDDQAGVKTVATRLGQSAALRMFQIFVIMFVVAAVTPWRLGLASEQYLLAVAACSILPTLGVAMLLGINTTDQKLRLSLRVMKLVWFTSLLPIALLR